MTNTLPQKLKSLRLEKAFRNSLLLKNYALQEQLFTTTKQEKEAHI